MEQYDDERRALIEQLGEFAALDVSEAGNERYLHAFADHAVLLPPDRSALIGRAAIRAFYDDMLRTVQSAHVAYDNPSVDVEGTLAVRRYTATTTLLYTGSAQEHLLRTKYLDVLRKQDGVWLITVHMWSSNDDSSHAN